MLCPTRCRLTAVLFGAMFLLAQGCGQGIFDHAVLSEDAGEPEDADLAPPMGLDAGIPSDPDAALDAAPEAGQDTVPDTVPDAGRDVGREVSEVAGPDGRTNLSPDGGVTQKIVDDSGDELILDEAKLTIGPGTFQNATLVTLRKIASIDHSGAWGPVFEISVSGVGLFRQVAKLTLQVPFIGANQQYLALGMLDPSVSVAVQQWVPASDSRLSLDQTSVTGSVTGFGTTSVLQYSAVVNCTTPGVVLCQAGEACNAGACQQCPTGSTCPP